MIKKQNLWLLTLFSLILILGVYYVTMPNEVLEKINIKTEELKEDKVEEESSLTSLRVSKETTRKEKIDSLESSLASDNLTSSEKNNTYELLKYLNEIQGIEEKLEKKIKKELGLDCYIKIDNSDANAICISKEHDKTLANKIMRLVQQTQKNKLNITVKFQKN
ncbi:MAG: SpoIIIAH-like family protein [Bacilli bacterium]|nr:SpoIIIAH-like family protein [Bacilli bacterium]